MGREERERRGGEGREEGGKREGRERGEGGGEGGKREEEQRERREEGWEIEGRAEDDRGERGEGERGGRKEIGEVGRELYVKQWFYILQIAVALCLVGGIRQKQPRYFLLLTNITCKSYTRFNCA